MVLHAALAAALALPALRSDGSGLISHTPLLALLRLGCRQLVFPPRLPRWLHVSVFMAAQLLLLGTDVASKYLLLSAGNF